VDAPALRRLRGLAKPASMSAWRNAAARIRTGRTVPRHPSRLGGLKSVGMRPDSRPQLPRGAVVRMEAQSATWPQPAPASMRAVRETTNSRQPARCGLGSAGAIRAARPGAAPPDDPSPPEPCPEPSNPKSSRHGGSAASFFCSREVGQPVFWIAKRPFLLPVLRSDGLVARGSSIGNDSINRRENGLRLG
jgi:hypothetical protein